MRSLQFAIVASWCSFVFLESDVAWQVTVMRIIDLLGVSEREWIVESIKLVPGLLDIVLNTVAVLIVNSSELVSDDTVASLEHADVLVLDWLSIFLALGEAEKCHQNQRGFHIFFY